MTTGVVPSANNPPKPTPTSHHVTIHNVHTHRIHYVEAAAGSPDLYRNIIPGLAKTHRDIAAPSRASSL